MRKKELKEMDLAEARFKRQWSQWELQKRSGVHQSRISLIENGYVAPTQKEKAAIVRALGIKAKDLEWPNQGSKASKA